MSKAAEKPKPKRPSGKNPSRRVKDPVERSEVYTQNLAPAGHGDKILAGKARANRLRELIEPETEAMVKVMVSIAKDEKVHASIRMECADRVLSRAYGKPKEHVEISDPADAAGGQDEVLALLGNIFEAVGLPPLLEGPSAEQPT